jgi:hypothetical protein
VAGAPDDPARVDALLVLGAVTALLAVAGWATLLALAATLQALGSAGAARTLHRCCPEPWRRTLLLACGLAAAAAVPAYGAGPGSPVGPTDGTSAPLGGLPALDRPVGAVPAAVARPGPGSTPAVRTIRVRPGDSLWRLVAARHPRADTATTVRLVGALYRANRSVIGPDPDLIRPGQQLRPADRAPHHPRRSRP